MSAGFLSLFHWFGGVSRIMLILNSVFWTISLVYIALFAVDLHQHNYCFERAIGLEESIRDSVDHVWMDRTVRIPHPSRRAWPIFFAAPPDAIPNDASWKEKLWLVAKADWRHSWHDIWTFQGGFHFWNIVSQVLTVCALVLFLGNLVLTIAHLIVATRARKYRMIFLGPIMPIWWAISHEPGHVVKVYHVVQQTVVPRGGVARARRGSVQ